MAENTRKWTLKARQNFQGSRPLSFPLSIENCGGYGHVAITSGKMSSILYFLFLKEGHLSLSFFFRGGEVPWYMEVPGSGIKPIPQWQPEPQQWQCRILNPLSHWGTPWVPLILYLAVDFKEKVLSNCFTLMTLGRDDGCADTQHPCFSLTLSNLFALTTPAPWLAIQLLLVKVIEHCWRKNSQLAKWFYFKFTVFLIWALNTTLQSYEIPQFSLSSSPTLVSHVLSHPLLLCSSADFPPASQRKLKPSDRNTFLIPPANQKPTCAFAQTLLSLPTSLLILLSSKASRRQFNPVSFTSRMRSSLVDFPYWNYHLTKCIDPHIYNLLIIFPLQPNLLKELCPLSLLHPL